MSKENANGIEEAAKKALGQDVKAIGENDTFKFHCVQCGQCCMNRRDIILNPFDIYNGAKYLGITCKEFFEQNCYISLGGHSKIPMVLLDTKDNGFCPLLKFDVKDGGKFKCTINPAKPGACSNHPIGVCFSMNKDTNTVEKIQYIKTEQCENSVSDEVHVVKDWVKPYTDHIEEINASHVIQQYITNFFDPRMFWFMCKYFTDPILAKENKDDIPEEDIQLCKLFASLAKVEISSTIDLGYLSFDINKPFLDQVDEILDALKDVYESCYRLYTKTKESFEKDPVDIDVDYGNTFEGFLEIIVGGKEN